MNVNFRVVKRHSFGGVQFYGLAEVYYDEQGNVEYYCFIDYDIADTIDEIKQRLLERLQAFELDVLDSKELDSLMWPKDSLVKKQ